MLLAAYVKALSRDADWPKSSQCCSPPAIPLSFGNRLWSGVCPPSNPARTPLPDRAFCPLIPNPQVPPYTDTNFAARVLTSFAG